MRPRNAGQWRGLVLRRVPVPTGSVIYVSNVAYRGMPIGNDANPGTDPAAPKLTLGSAFTAAAAGATIFLNGDPASPATYRAASTAYTWSKAVSLHPVWPYGAIVMCAAAAAAQLRVIHVNISAGTMTFGKLIVDADNVHQAGFSFNDTAAAMSVTFDGTKMRNGTLYGAYSIGTATRLNAAYNGVVIELGDARTGIMHSGLVAGSVSIAGGSIRITDQNVSGHGGVLLTATQPGISAALAGTEVNVNLKSTLTGTGTHFGVRFYNLVNAKIEAPVISITGNPGARKAVGATIQTSLPASGTEQSINGGVIRRARVFNGANGGSCVQIGDDLQTEALADGLTLEDNVVSGNAAFVAGAGHSVFFVNVRNPLVRNNRASTGGIGIVDKQTTNSLVYGNHVEDHSSSYYLMKGATNPYHHDNTARATGIYNGIFLSSVNGDGAGYGSTTGGRSENNVHTVAGASGAIFADIDAANVVTFSGNEYRLESGDLNANPWRYQGTTYPTLAAWQAAREANATGSGVP